MRSNPYSNIFGDKSMPVGGNVKLYASIHVFHLRRLKLDNYHAELDINPCYPRKITDFVIDHRGVEGGGTQAPLRRRI
jgi:hypothetical protein